MIFAQTLKLLTSVIIGTLVLVDDQTSDHAFHYVHNQTAPYDLGTVLLLGGVVRGVHGVRDVLLPPIPRIGYYEHTRNYTMHENQTFVFVENEDGILVFDTNSTIHSFDWDIANESKRRENIYHLAIARLINELNRRQNIEVQSEITYRRYTTLKRMYANHVIQLIVLIVFLFAVLMYAMTLRTIDDFRSFVVKIFSAAFITVVWVNSEVLITLYNNWE